MTDLERAIDLAVTAHRGQVDKAGKPYILHPLRVMFRGRGNHEMIVGVLHDVVEDTTLTLRELNRFFPFNLTRAIDCLTHRKNEPWVDYLSRVQQSDLAVLVKMNDLEDNMDPDRLKSLDHETRGRLAAKYKYAHSLLKRYVDKWGY